MGPRNQEELNKLISCVLPVFTKFSNFSWTPFTNREGAVYDDRGNRVEFDPLPGLGDGVIIDLARGRLEYRTPSWLASFSCRVRSSAKLLLRGRSCNTSLLGRFLFPFFMRIFLQMFGTLWSTLKLALLIKAGGQPP